MKTTLNYYSRSRPEILKFVPENIKTILDVGCGEGDFLKLVKEQTGAKTWGVEVESKVADKAKDKADYVMCGKIEEMLNSLPDAYFDCITFNDVLEHLIEPSNILKMIKIKLTEKGIIIASIPNVRYFTNLYELLIKKDWKYTDTGILDSTHLRFYTQSSMKKMLIEAGYELINQVGIFKIRGKKFRLFNLITMGFFNDTKYLQFICIAKIDKMI